MTRLIGYFFILLFPLFPKVLAQEKRSIEFVASEADQEVLDHYNFKKASSDSISLIQNLNDLIIALQQDGYLTAHIKRITISAQNTKVNIEVGGKYKWALLGQGNVDEVLINKIGYRERFFRDKPFRYSEVSRLFKKILDYSESNGYPFASVRLDSLEIEDNLIKASINYHSGPMITFDSLVIQGDTKTREAFLASYLRIKPGELYEERKIANAGDKLSRLPYLKMTAPPYVTFQNNEAKAYFNLEDKRSSQVDGIIGLLPNENAESGVLVTGQFNLLLQNLLGSGKKLEFEWQRLKENTQLLNTGYYHPNIAGSPLDAGLKFNLFKEDTLYINRALEIEFSYLLGGYSSLQIFGNFKTSRLISESQFKDAGSLPDFADFDLNSYGLRYSWGNLDDFFTPKKGNFINMEGGVGSKKIKKNPALDEKLYDSVVLRNVQYNFKGGFTRYFRVGKRMVLKSSISGGKIIGDRLFFNDLFRLGGLKSVRGFVENEFFASDFMIATIEPQFFLDNESYLFAFFDQSYMKYDLNNRHFKDYPSGVGLGLNFTTGAGVFSFVYALGRTGQQPFSFNLSKIHFGYITRF